MSVSIRKQQRGDTIVEVLMAIVVVSMVLVAAYVTTTRNINGVEDTQEHSEALQLAQAQIEFLHDTTKSPAKNQCFDTNGNIVGNAKCKVDASGNPTTGQPQFTVAITHNNPTTYKVAVTWFSLNQDAPSNSVTLYYQP